MRQGIVTNARAIALIVAGIVLLVTPSFKHAPRLEDLKPIEGRLISYSLHEHQLRSKVTTYAHFRIEGYPGSFWNDSLKDASANLLHGRDGAQIRSAYDPSAPLAGAEDATTKSYGLSIDGVEVQSTASAVGNDRFLFHVIEPAIAITLIVLGCLWVTAWRRTPPN
jgi:hypothetical protein